MKQMIHWLLFFSIFQILIVGQTKGQITSNHKKKISIGQIYQVKLIYSNCVATVLEVLDQDYRGDSIEVKNGRGPVPAVRLLNPRDCYPIPSGEFKIQVISKKDAVYIHKKSCDFASQVPSQEIYGCIVK